MPVSFLDILFAVINWGLLIGILVCVIVLTKAALKYLKRDQNKKQD